MGGATGVAFFNEGVSGWNTSSAVSQVNYGTSKDKLDKSALGYAVSPRPLL